MIEVGIWKAKKQRQSHVHQRRARRERFGELVQADGSPEYWFEDRGEKCSLIVFVDDATSTVPVARFSPTETSEAYLECLKEHLERYGRPCGLYVDRHSIFRVNRDEVEKGTAITHFGRVVRDLDIELICANSPQAKGRVERKHGVFQDRLIKEMRLRGISSIEQGNAFLPEYLERHNRQFGKASTRQEDAHRPLRGQDDIERIFAHRAQRKLSKNLTFQYEGKLYQLKTTTPNRLRHACVDILRTRGGAVEVEYQSQKLDYEIWEEKVYEQPPIIDTKELAAKWIMHRPPTPSKSHPWRSAVHKSKDLRTVQRQGFFGATKNVLEVSVAPS